MERRQQDPGLAQAARMASQMAIAQPKAIPLEEVGERLHMARWRRRITLRELAKELGVTFTSLHRIERRGVPKAVKHYEKVRDWLTGEES